MGNASFAMLGAVVFSLAVENGTLPRRQSGQDRANQRTRIAGRVIDVGEGTQPLRLARVMLESVDPTRPASVLAVETDSDGNYEFEGAPEGEFALRCEKPGYLMVGDGSGATIPRSPVGVHLARGRSTAVNLFMRHASAIEGNVFGRLGRPIPGATVSAFRVVLDTAGRRPDRIATSLTDAAGRFRIHSLPPGSYYVDAILNGRALAADRGAVEWSRMYHPAALRLSDAEVVSVGLGQEMSSVDVAFQSYSGTPLTVNVTDSLRQRPREFAVWLQPEGGYPGDVLGLRMPDQSHAIFPSVPPGNYYVSGTVRRASNGAEEDLLARISIQGGLPATVTVASRPGVTVVGHIEEESTVRVPVGAKVVAYSTLLFVSPTARSTSVRKAVVDGSGRFELKDIVGPRLIRVEGLGGCVAMTSATFNGVQITDKGFDFEAAERLPELSIVVTSNTAALNGRVIIDDRPALGVQVIAFTDNRELWYAQSRFIRFVATDELGAYSICGLLPGKYLVAASPQVGSVVDPDLLERLSSIATPVTLTATSLSVVDLALRIK